MTAAMEGIMEYVLRRSEEALPVGPKTKKRKRSKMVPRELRMACENDQAMDDLLHNMVVAGGGVLPHMPQGLMGRAPRRKKRRKRPAVIVATKKKKKKKKKGRSNTKKRNRKRVK